MMIGWEYPPHNSGGLGVACQGLTESLSEQGTEIYFTLPYSLPGAVDHMTVMPAVHPNWSSLSKYVPPFPAYGTAVRQLLAGQRLGAAELRVLPRSQLEQRVAEYAQVVRQQARDLREKIDVIHAHDWMSVPAGLAARQATGKPLILHVHSTEADRIPGGGGSPYIKEMERLGLVAADKVIAVSSYTARLLESEYAVPASKIAVVHNGASTFSTQSHSSAVLAPGRPVIVFMGRLTAQKGPTYFLQLAESVLKEAPDALFVVAGDGDLYHELLLSSAYRSLSAQVLFTGFLRDKQREKLLDRASIFVMPSLSEPFGLVALEAAHRRTPVIISAQAGVKEVLPSALAIDFWDIKKMTATILELLSNKGLYRRQVQQQLSEVSKVTWEKSAQKINKEYRFLFTGKR
jgi:glycogen(starch) synthase